MPEHKLPPPPLSLSWTTGDTVDGGVIEIRDGQGFQVAAVEAARSHMWRFSDVGLRLKELIDIFNVHAPNRKEPVKVVGPTEADLRRWKKKARQVFSLKQRPGSAVDQQRRAFDLAQDLMRVFGD